jgi:hypothetical protein
LVAEVVWIARLKPELEATQNKVAARQMEIPAPTAHPIVQRAVAHRARGGVFRSEEGSMGTAWRLDHADYSDTLPPQAQMTLARDVTAMNSDESMPLLAPLVAYLVREAHQRWQRGEERFDYVPLLMGRDELRRLLGVKEENQEREIQRCLEWLQAFAVGGHRCVAGWSKEKAPSGSGGGRPQMRWVVQLGPALAPQGLARVFTEAGMTLPPSLRFYAPVLDPAAAPLAGNRRTHERQRTFYALGLGALLMDHREEYAERGGVQLDAAAWRLELKRQGIYHRSHASLADTIFDALRASPVQEDLLAGAGGAVLVEVTPGSGRYRFGPNFTAPHRAVVGAAEVTAEARADRQKKGAKRRRGVS